MLDHLGQTKRTHSCGELRREHVGQTVTLMCWVNSYRDHGSLLFIHLRDRDGVAQVVFREEVDARLLERARQARSEYVLSVTGELVARTEENYNPNMATGEVEVLASELKILNDAQTPPFEIDNCKAAEDLRLKYRYLDLRRPEMQRNFKLRHELALATRRALDAQGFYEIETPILELFKAAGVEPPATPFPRMAYAEAMNRFGSDKPDLRFGLELIDLSAQFEGGAFTVFADAVKKGGAVKGVVVPGAANWSRKRFDDIVEHAKKHGAGGLAYIQVLEGESKSALTKSLGAEGVNAVIEAAGAKAGEAIMMVGGKWDVVCNALGQVRLEVGRSEKLIDESQYRLLWVVNFPMFEYHENDKRWYAMHHPFTSPVDEDLDKLESDPGSVRAKAYDLVFNGAELGGGSIRIHRSDVQSRVFKALGMSEEESREKFGFFLDALSYGTPPHGGIAIGLDRTVMLFAKAKSLREVIAFPKVASGSDLMIDSPSAVAPGQLAELKIKTLA